VEDEKLVSGAIIALLPANVALLVQKLAIFLPCVHVLKNAVT